MAVAKESVTLEFLLEWEPDSSEDEEILERAKRLAELYLPDGWRQWKVVTHSRAELLGEVFDSQILNKIRFSLPTVELARAFCPDCTSLPEKVYKDIKIKMLEWPFCVELIIGPPSIGRHSNPAYSSLKELTVVLTWNPGRLILREPQSEVLMLAPRINPHSTTSQVLKNQDNPDLQDFKGQIRERLAKNGGTSRDSENIRGIFYPLRDKTSFYPSDRSLPRAV
ncbi:unnamed protein product [Parnassius apollo]|uniref:(apollo) hypothetical protein n=1 Tax=Parnassius apollo TaxID=110799 RepID=A0A8S3Y3Y5_PARAO|nr:unnamed protein product [Parnassius apollo]